MKRLLVPSLSALLAALGLLLAGCGGGGGAKLETAELTEAFASGDAALKTSADEAVKLLTSGKYLEGTTSLVKLAQTGGDKLTEPQKNALINACASIQLVISEDASKNDERIHQAVENLMAAVEGRDASKVGVTPDLPGGAKVPKK